MSVWLADLKNEHGINGYYQMQELSNRLTHAIVEKMTRTVAFSRLSEVVGYHPARTYLLVRCKALVEPLARACMLADNLPPGHPQLSERVTISDPVIYSLLREVWPSSRVDMCLQRGLLEAGIVRARIRGWMRNLLQAFPSSGVAASPGVNAAIGVECDPVNISRGTALSRFSTISSDRVILCFNQRGYPFRKDTLSNLEKEGFRWVSLVPGAVEGFAPIWRPGPTRSKTVTQYRHAVNNSNAKDLLERWVARAAVSLLSRVDYWRTFFSQHGIQVYLLYSVDVEDNIAKRIAIALEGGVLIFLQRSHVVARGDAVGRRAGHVVFSWGDPESVVSHENENYNENFVITGFIGENSFADGEVQGQEYRQRLMQRGARFAITLFDNGYSPEIMFSRSTLVLFYRHFLTWVLEGKDNGLVIKPKRDAIPRGLSEIRDLVAAAEATGRCLILSQEEGAHTAAFAADLSVGLGHSSASVISAIAGCRAVHCDLGRTPDHPLASWGLGRLLFYDLESLASAIESHKEDPGRSALGDFTPVMDDLDPFRDGRAGERIENYLHWLLEAFDAGYGRDAAIEQANQQYARAWGSDKVISPQDRHTLNDGD